MSFNTHSNSAIESKTVSAETNHNWTWVLGSRSPRRLELLRQIVPTDSIEVLPPRDSAEAGFEGIFEQDAIERQLLDIARTKCRDVVSQLSTREAAGSDRRSFVVIAADTEIIVHDATGSPVVLGKPPEDDTWPETVRHWFQEYYFGTTHLAATALCVALHNGESAERIVKTQVTFAADGRRWLDWYLSTGEPRGKAGGYAIQGAGGLFASKIEGSLSNVVGLPQRELLEMHEQLGVM